MLPAQLIECGDLIACRSQRYVSDWLGLSQRHIPIEEPESLMRPTTPRCRLQNASIGCVIAMYLRFMSHRVLTSGNVEIVLPVPQESRLKPSPRSQCFSRQRCCERLMLQKNHACQQSRHGVKRRGKRLKLASDSGRDMTLQFIDIGLAISKSRPN